MFSDDLETHLPDLRAYARVLCGDVVRADDIVQNACLKAWENRASFDPQKGALRGWLFRIVRNEFFQQKRAERVRETDPATAHGSAVGTLLSLVAYAVGLLLLPARRSGATWSMSPRCPPVSDAMS